MTAFIALQPITRLQEQSEATQRAADIDELRECTATRANPHPSKQLKPLSRKTTALRRALVAANAVERAVDPGTQRVEDAVAVSLLQRSARPTTASAAPRKHNKYM